MNTPTDQHQEEHDPIVWVRRQWDDYRHAKYLLADVENPRWDTISGGIQKTTPQPFIHGYVWCGDMLEGELAHSCMHGEGPHRIKICVVRKDNTSSVFVKLQAMAGPKPTRTRRNKYPAHIGRAPGVPLPHLKSWRIKNLLEQTELAALAGRSKSTISLLENGKQRASLATVRKLASALHTTPETLLSRPPEPVEEPPAFSYPENAMNYSVGQGITSERSREHLGRF